MAHERPSIFWTVLFCGAAWGLAESTLGHVLHGLKVPGLAGAVMFPLAFFFMGTAGRLSHRPEAAMAASWVAAGLKLLDLWLPASDPASVLNPVAAILIEGFVIFFALRYPLPENRGNAWKRIFAVSFAWRVLYLFFAWVTAAGFGQANLLGQEGWSMARFLLLEGTAGAFIACGLREWILGTDWRTRFFRMAANPALALLTVLLAIVTAAAG